MNFCLSSADVFNTSFFFQIESAAALVEGLCRCKNNNNKNIIHKLFIPRQNLFLLFYICASKVEQKKITSMMLTLKYIEMRLRLIMNKNNVNV